MKPVILYSHTELQPELLSKLADIGVDVHVHREVPDGVGVVVLGSDSLGAIALAAEMERRQLFGEGARGIVMVNRPEAECEMPDIGKMMAQLTVPEWPTRLLEDLPVMPTPRQERQFPHPKHFSPKHQAMAAKSRR